MHCYKPIISLNNCSLQIRVCQWSPKRLKSLFEAQRRENLFLISLLCSSRTEVSGMDTKAQWGLTRIPVLPGAGFDPWHGAGAEEQFPAMGVRVLQHHGEHMPGDTGSWSGIWFQNQLGHSLPKVRFYTKASGSFCDHFREYHLQKASRWLWQPSGWVLGTTAEISHPCSRPNMSIQNLSGLSEFPAKHCVSIYINTTHYLAHPND